MQVILKKTCLENRFSTLQLDQRGVLHVFIKPFVCEGGCFLQEYVQDLQKISAGKALNVVVHQCIYHLSDPKVRKYLFAKEVLGFYRKIAFFNTQGNGAFHFAAYYINFLPCRVFRNLSKAISWLETCEKLEMDAFFVYDEISAQSSLKDYLEKCFAINQGVKTLTLLELKNARSLSQMIENPFLLDLYCQKLAIINNSFEKKVRPGIRYFFSYDRALKWLLSFENLCISNHSTRQLELAMPALMNLVAAYVERDFSQEFDISKEAKPFFRRLLMALKVLGTILQKDGQAIQKQKLQLIEHEDYISLGRWVSRLGHELSNPLFLLKGFYKQLQKDLRPFVANRVQVDLLAFEEQIGRIEELLLRVKDFSKIAQEERQSLAISPIVQRAIAFVQKKFNLSQEQLFCCLCPDSVHVLASCKQLEQVFINILDYFCRKYACSCLMIEVLSRLEPQKLVLQFFFSFNRRACRSFIKAHKKDFLEMDYRIVKSIIEKHGGQIDYQLREKKWVEISLPFQLEELR